MKNYNYLLTVCLCCIFMSSPGLGFGQNQSKNVSNPLFQVVYEFSVVEDTTQKDRPLKEGYSLYLNQTESIFRRITEEESEYYRFLQSGGRESEFDINSIRDKTASIFQSLEDKILIDTKRIITEMYQTRENTPEFEWEILDDMRTLNGFKVQKAKTSFRGRDYEVWFTMDIPISLGPWKFSGLPGLILEAKDSKNEVVFTLKSIEELENNSLDLDYSKNIQIVTLKEYAKIYKVFRDNPSVFIRNLNAGAGGNIRIGVATGAGSAGARSNSIKPIEYNNPIELSFPL